MPFHGKTIFFLGKLAASNRKEATELVRRQQGRVAREIGPNVNVVVVGDGNVVTPDWNLWNDKLDAATREAFENGSLEIVSEAVFWDKIGGDTPHDRPASPLYTPSMLAELSGLPISMIRQLQRRQLLVPRKQVHRLLYFDFQDVLLLKIVRNMLEAGVSLNVAAKQLGQFHQRHSKRPLNVNIDGKDVLFLTESGPVDQDGQRLFSFVWDRESEPADASSFSETNFDERTESLATLDEAFHSTGFDWESLCAAAWELESSGDLDGAIDVYRTALAANGPNAQICFQIAELLYRLGDRTAARERYFMAVELDEEFVEARANLGCVLAELGNDELAAAAFRGALKYHPDYAEVHYHLGMLLDRVGLPEEGEEHLRLFLELMPDSPWAERVLEKLSPKKRG